LISCARLGETGGSSRPVNSRISPLTCEGGLGINLTLAFLHGEEVLIGLPLAAGIILVGVPLLLYIWLWHTKVSELKLAIVYCALVSLLCGMLSLNLHARPSVSLLTALCLGFLLTLPWSALGEWLLSNVDVSAIGDHKLEVVMLFGAVINAVILHFIAVKMRRLIR
jgi:hypothetical protein